MEQAIWRLTQVGVRGADRPRLQNITTTFTAGITAVLGPSGAGKTTLLNLLVGFEKPTEGQIECGMRSAECGIANDLFRNPQSATRIPVFWCPPDHGLWPHLTARQHLEAAACQSRCGRIDEMLGAFDLLDHADTRPDHLSQGQRSRLSVARALVTGAAVLVMDEPLVHVDEERVPRYWSVIRRVLDETGASLVFSTHDSAAAREHAQHTLRLSEGKLVDGESARRDSATLRMPGRLIALLVLCLFIGACDSSADAALPVHQVLRHILPSDGPKAPAPRDAAVGEGDELLVIDNAGRIVVIDRKIGRAVRQWRTPTNENGNPEGIARLRDGRIAVADTHYCRVLFFDGQGQLLSTLGEKGDGPGQFRYPVKIAEDDAGHLYVAEYGGNDRIQKFAADGTFLKSMGSFGTGEQQFQRPSGLVWHDGRLYIADAINNRILIYSDEGRYLGVLGAAVPLKLPYDLARGPDGSFYIIEYQAGRLTVLDSAGRLVGRFEGGNDRLRTPWGVEVDPEGTIWIAETGAWRLVEVRR